nr:reverse transcriptase domain-containing protein [Tanacetum cinerariifolium]
VPAEMLRDLDQQMKESVDGGLYFIDQIWVPLVGSIMDEALASSLRYLSDDGIESPWILSLSCRDVAESVGNMTRYEYSLSSLNEWTKYSAFQRKKAKLAL